MVVVVVIVVVVVVAVAVAVAVNPTIGHRVPTPGKSWIFS